MKKIGTKKRDAKETGRKKDTEGISSKKDVKEINTEETGTKKKKPIHSAGANFIWSLKMLLKYSPAAFAIMALFVFLNLGLQYFQIYLPALVVSEVTNARPLSHAIGAVGAVMLAMLLCNTLKSTLNFVRISKTGTYRYTVTSLLVRKKLNFFYQTYEKKEIRDLAERAVRALQMWDGVQPITDIVTNGFGLIENLLGYLLFGTVISFASPWLVPLLTIAPAVHIFSVRAYQKWEYAHRERIADLDGKMNFVEGISGDFSAAKDIRIYSMASWLRECYQGLSKERRKYDSQNANRLFFAGIAQLFVILARDGGAYALLISMVLSGEISVDRFVLYFAAIASFASWVGGIVNHWNGIHEASLQICDFREYIDYPDQEGLPYPEQEGACCLEQEKHYCLGQEEAYCPKQAGGVKINLEEFLGNAPEIVFDRVCFRYGGADKDTIHDLSFTLHAGEKLALVGLNGAGKTTIVKLLCGLYSPTSGEIRINGVPLGRFARRDYYKLVSPVFQDVSTGFFHLAEMVSGRFLEETDLQKAEECLRRAGLGHKLDTLEKGIHTKLNKHVHKDGTELSGGEAQKLMLARALYKDAPLLVLDEPTAALDPIAESGIYTEYNRMMQEKTSLFISHRLASTFFCDRILLLEDGQIAEEGTHKELMQKDGKYKKLFDIQSCWYQEKEKGGAAV